MSNLNYSFYQLGSKRGAIVFKDDKLIRHFLPENSDKLQAKLSKIFPEATQKINFAVIEQVLRFFRGKSVKFKVKMALDDLTDFEKKVLKQCQKIPYGKTVTYRELAKNLGTRSYQAVGNALGKNPLPVFIPCHRVVKSGGSIGGFSGPPGMKKRLLELEAKK